MTYDQVAAATILGLALVAAGVITWAAVSAKELRRRGITLVKFRED